MLQIIYLESTQDNKSESYKWWRTVLQVSKSVKIHGSKLLLTLSLRAGSKTIFVVANFERKAYGIITISCNKSNE